MKPQGILSDAEIKKGHKVHPMDFGDLLFRGVVDNPMWTDSGLIYARDGDGKLFYTEISPNLISRLK